MAEIWFTSDWHHDHLNIIRYASRPFDNVHQMNECLIENHNKYVKPQDHWYNLGDLTMARDGRGIGLNFIRGLNGHKRLIMGNHDHYAIKHYVEHFEKVMAMQRFDGLWFTHVPVHPSNMGGSVTANIHGHIHQNPSPEPVLIVDKEQRLHVKPYVNICVEQTNYHPLSLEQLRVMVRDLRGGEVGEGWS